MGECLNFLQKGNVNEREDSCGHTDSGRDGVGVGARRNRAGEVLSGTLGLGTEGQGGHFSRRRRGYVA